MLYVDTSALVKLVRVEAESEALRTALADHVVACCELVLTELYRAVVRYADDEGRERVDLLLRSVELLTLDRSLLARAGRMAPAQIRSSDAIHVAAATVLGGALVALVTYDRLMASAARFHGLDVWSPGMDP
ncbi:MAG: type II toxin-antitoxin system VapC family toxin [Geodermatophilaceae bacterium]